MNVIRSHETRWMLHRSESLNDYSLSQSEWCGVAAGEEAVDVGLGVPVFVAVAGVAEETVVAEAFQIAVFDSEDRHQGFVIVNTRESFGVSFNLAMEFCEFVIDGLQCDLGWVVNHQRWILEEFFYREDDIPEDDFVS